MNSPELTFLQIVWYFYQSGHSLQECNTVTFCWKSKGVAETDTWGEKRKHKPLTIISLTWVNVMGNHNSKYVTMLLHGVVYR